MVHILYHEADATAASAVELLTELAEARLLQRVRVAKVGGEAVGPPSVIGRDRSDSVGVPRLVAAVATENLEAGGLAELARAADFYRGEQQDLAGETVDGLRLYVPGFGRRLEPESLACYFSSQVANVVALPVDWVSPTAEAEPIVPEDADRFAWHTALELVTVTGAWSVSAHSPWRPEPDNAFIGETALRFTRSMSRLVTVTADSTVVGGDGVLPVPSGYIPSVVPERAELAAASLIPAEFRVPGPADKPGGKLRGDFLLLSLQKALQSLFPVAGRGFRAAAKGLRDEWRRELAEDLPQLDETESAASESDASEGSERALAQLGLDPKLWTDLVRRVLGVADGAAIATQARRDAGGEAILFVSGDGLVDDLLEEELSSLGSNGDPTDDLTAGDQTRPVEGSPDGDSRWRADAEPAAGDQSAGEPRAGPRRRGLLTLVGEQLVIQIDNARQRRADRAEKLAELAALEGDRGSSAGVQAPTLVRATAAAFVIVAFGVVASHVLLLDALSVSEMDSTLRTALAVVATAVTWFLLAVPLAPTTGGPAAVQSYLMRVAVIVAVPAAGATVFAEQLALASSRFVRWEILTIGFVGVTAWLFYMVVKSANALRRPVARSMSLSWTVAFLIVGLFLYANRDDSLFGRSTGATADHGPSNAESVVGIVEQDFLEQYGPSLRNAALIVAALLFVLAVVLLAISVGSDLRRAALIESRRRALRASAEDDRDVPGKLAALRINWLGTAAALDHLLRVLLRRRDTASERLVRLEPPIARFKVRSRTVAQPPPDPDWIYGRYRAAASAFTDEMGLRESPETSRLVSRPSPALGTEPSEDPRWEFARRLREGAYDEQISLPPGSSLPGVEKHDLDLVCAIEPDRPLLLLPLGQIGLAEAGLGRVEMDTKLWLPQSAGGAPEVLTVPGGLAAQSVRLDVSEPVELSALRERRLSAPSADDLPEILEPPDDPADYAPLV